MTAVTRNVMVGVALVLAMQVSSVQGGMSYSGSIPWDAAETNLAATNDWEKSTTALTWTVADNMNGTWHYEYVFATAKKDLSHIIFEVSANVTAADILHATVNGIDWSNDVSVQTFTSGNGNPLIPGPLYGVKFDSTSGTLNAIAFDISRLPTWGDFYAKGGGGNSTGAVTAVNSGFLAADPLSIPANGPLSGHILVPDTIVPPPIGTEAVPEPASIVLWGFMAGVGLLFAWRQSKTN